MKKTLLPLSYSASNDGSVCIPVSHLLSCASNALWEAALLRQTADEMRAYILLPVKVVMNGAAPAELREGFIFFDVADML